MEKMVFDCEMISPLFLYGADQNTPEFRAPSLKGVFRFWWRAAQAEKDIQKLRSMENRIFGGSGSKPNYEHRIGDTDNCIKEGRSCFSLKISSQGVQFSRKSMLPHKPTNFKPKAIVNTPFQIECSYIRLPEDFSAEHLQALVELTSLLGGLGKRSRRGFGSFRILRFNGQESDLAKLSHEEVLPQILNRLNLISCNKFILNNGVIQLKNNPNSSYPYIETIALGKSCQDVASLLEKIGTNSHDKNSIYTGFSIKNERLASPEYVSLIKGEKEKIWPVVTSLHLVFNPKPDPRVLLPQDQDTRREFREAILS